MSVSALVLESGSDEDQAIAALLHDAVEDQGGLPTLETIRRMFGERVAKIVRECSDSESPNPDNKPPWHQRRQAYLQHLHTASPEAVLVAVADKLHNVRAILTDYRQVGDRVWQRFNKEATKEDQLEFYSQLIETLRQIAAPTVMVDEMDKLLKELDGPCSARVMFSASMNHFNGRRFQERSDE